MKQTKLLKIVKYTNSIILGLQKNLWPKIKTDSNHNSLDIAKNLHETGEFIKNKKTLIKIGLLEQLEFSVVSHIRGNQENKQENDTSTNYGRSDLPEVLLAMVRKRITTGLKVKYSNPK